MKRSFTFGIVVMMSLAFTGCQSGVGPSGAVSPAPVAASPEPSAMPVLSGMQTSMTKISPSITAGMNNVPLAQIRVTSDAAETLTGILLVGNFVETFSRLTITDRDGRVLAIVPTADLQDTLQISFDTPVELPESYTHTLTVNGDTKVTTDTWQIGIEAWQGILRGVPTRRTGL